MEDPKGPKKMARRPGQVQQVLLNTKINQPPASEGRKEGSRKFQDVLIRVTTDNPNGLVRFIAHSGIDDINSFICEKGG